MPEPSLTKKALAQTFKELVCKESFEKVSVSDICAACQVSRKTFYYHFQDKYALMQWIFDTEYIAVWKRSRVTDRWAIVASLCRYLYSERVFYEKLIEYRGQNSFRQYFQDFLFGILESFVLPEQEKIDAVAGRDGVPAADAQAFFAHFITDAVLFAIFRWLTDGAQQSPEEFVTLLKSTSDLMSTRLTE